jgi:hypothetical protein
VIELLREQRSRLLCFWVFRRAESSRWEREMNWDRLEGNRVEFKGKVRERWGKLTDDEVRGFEADLDREVETRA